MDIETLIVELRSYKYWLGQDGPESHDIHPKICDKAADAISALRAEITQWKTRCNSQAQEITKITAQRDDFMTAAKRLDAENAQLRRRLSEAVSACSRIAEWAQDTGHDYVEGIARDFLGGEGNRP